MLCNLDEAVTERSHRRRNDVDDATWSSIAASIVEVLGFNRVGTYPVPSTVVVCGLDDNVDDGGHDYAASDGWFAQMLTIPCAYLHILLSLSLALLTSYCRRRCSIIVAIRLQNSS